MARWLGINSFEFKFNERTVLLDLCVTRRNSAVLTSPEFKKLKSGIEYFQPEILKPFEL